MRNPKLEELRKRLLTQPVPSAPPPYATPTPGEIFSPLPNRSTHPLAVESEGAASINEE